MNTLAPADRPAPIDFAPLNARREPYRLGEPLDLRGPIFLTALGLLLIDALIVFWLAGGACAPPVAPRRAAAAASLLLHRRASTMSSALRGRRAADDDAVRHEGHRCRRGSPMSSPAMPKSTMSARRACRG